MSGDVDCDEMTRQSFGPSTGTAIRRASAFRVADVRWPERAATLRRRDALVGFGLR